jgi:hypothetical protein
MSKLVDISVTYINVLECCRCAVYQCYDWSVTNTTDCLWEIDIKSLLIWVAMFVYALYHGMQRINVTLFDFIMISGFVFIYKYSN